MSEEADPIHFDEDNGDVYGVRVIEWEIDLPTAGDLTPLSQPLVPPELASAFSIQPEPACTILDVHRASQETLSSLLHVSCGGGGAEDPENLIPNLNNSDSSSPEDQSARALKRSRLVWTPQLHKRFIEVVAHLGIKNSVPKTIMQLMNVEGLTRENVASHLQKYRLYLKRKRMSGFSKEGLSVADPIFATTPVPENLMTAQQLSPQPQAKHVPMPYAVIPMPMYEMHRGYDGNYQQQHLFGNGSVVSYPHRVTPNDK